MACQNISEQIRWGRKVLQINLHLRQARVCLLRVMFFSLTISKKHKTASSVPAFHRRHNKVQNDVCYWSEWELMGLPEHTDKTHRAKRERNYTFSPSVSAAALPVLSSPLPISQSYVPILRML